jgi:hypothetical protein
MGIVMILIGVGVGVLGLSMIFEWFSWRLPIPPKAAGVILLIGAAALVVTGLLNVAGVI